MRTRLKQGKGNADPSKAVQAAVAETRSFTGLRGSVDILGDGYHPVSWMVLWSMGASCDDQCSSTRNKWDQLIRCPRRENNGAITLEWKLGGQNRGSVRNRGGKRAKEHERWGIACVISAGNYRTTGGHGPPGLETGQRGRVNLPKDRYH